MNWRFQCAVCGVVFDECMREDEAYYVDRHQTPPKVELNITHCDKTVKILRIGAPI